MNRSVTLFLRTWALGITAWTIVYTREVPTALAQAPIETDCSTNLDQPDTTYILSSDAVANCVIAADNIILDGQSLFGLGSNTIYSTADDVGFTVRNVISGEWRAYIQTEEATFNIENSTLSHGYSFQNDGDINIINSTITNESGNSFFGTTGRLTVDNSNIAGSFNGTNFTVTDSTVERISGGGTISNSTIEQISNGASIAIEDDSLITGTVVLSTFNAFLEVTDSTIQGVISTTGASPSITATRSVLEGGIDLEDSGESDVLIVDSTVQGIVATGDGSYNNVGVTNSVIESGVDLSECSLTGISVTNSTVHGAIEFRSGHASVISSEVHGAVDSYNFADTTVTDSTIHGEIDMYSGYASVIRSLVDGDVGRVSTLDVEDSTITGDVNVTGALTIIDNAPSLTVTPLTLSLSYGEKFNPFEDATASDIKDGDLSADVTVIGEAGQAEGVYELIYSVTDEGTSLFNIANGGSTHTAGPSTASTTRTITRGNKPTQSTSVGAHKERKEKQAAEEAALPSDTTALIETLRTTLEAPGSTNDPEALKQVIDLVRQLIVALLELLAAQGKVK